MLLCQKFIQELHIFKILLFLISFCFCNFIYAYDTVNIKEYMYYEDFDSKKNINDILNIKDWKKTQNINFGYSKSTYWIKLNIDTLDENIKYFLLSENHKIELLNLYIVKDNHIIRQYEGGFQRIKNDEISTRKDIFPLINDKEIFSYDIFISIKSNFYPLNNNLKILPQNSVETFIYIDNFIINTCCLLLLTLFIMHSLIFTISKLSFYKYYIVYLFFVLIVVSFESGILNSILFKSGIKDIYIAIFRFFGVLIIICLINLFKFILDLNEKKSSKYINFMMLTLFINVVFSNFLRIFDWQIIWLIHVANINFMIIIIYMLYILVSRSLKKCLLSFLLILIWLPLFGVIIFHLLNNIYGSLDEISTEHLVMFLFIYESIFISLILAYKYSLIEKEKKELIVASKDKEILYLRQSKLLKMGEMLNNIAHQWKQPLARINSIIFNSYDLIDENKKDELKTQLCNIENETLYMSNTISTLLNFFHLNKQKEEINLYELANNQKNFLAKYNFTNLIINCSNPNIITFGYKSEYEQVVQVIIENAIESLQNKNEQKIIISISKEDDLTIFCIENNGDYIKEEYLDKIFEPYFTTKEKDKHQGIGLYMSKMLIEDSMGKKLKVCNTNVGVKFTIEG